jgi:hypothetical protein
MSRDDEAEELFRVDVGAELVVSVDLLVRLEGHLPVHPSLELPS